MRIWYELFEQMAKSSIQICAFLCESFSGCVTYSAKNATMSYSCSIILIKSSYYNRRSIAKVCAGCICEKKV